MVAMRIAMHRLQEFVRLHRLSTGFRETARLLGISPNTERAYRSALHQAGLLDGDPTELPPLEILKQAIAEQLGSRPPPPHTISTVVAWTTEVTTMLGRGAGARAIYDALRLRPDFKGSLSAVKRLCAHIKRARGISPEDVAIPVSTVAGETAQVDFGYVGRLYDPLSGTERRAWVFVMVLSHSRHMFVDVVFDQSTRTWIDLHIRAFHYFGGVPRIVRPDNLKAAVIRAAFRIDDAIALNRTYRELARHYGFRIDPAPPRQPKKKGKAEAGVKYVKNNFFRPRGLTDVGDVRAQLPVWLREVAGMRTHGTTGKKPIEMFESEERAALLPMPERPYEVVEWKPCEVHPDSHIFFDKRLYSVPWKRIGEEVWVRATPTTVVVYAGDDRVATHDRRGREKRSTYEEHLPEGRRDYRQRQRSYWEERAAALGDEVARYIKAVFDSDDVLYQLRVVQASVRHLEQFPRSRANAACARALHFGNLKYGGLKEILRKGLDLMALPEAATVPAPIPLSFRFARQPGELVQPKLEPQGSEGKRHEYH